MGRDERFLNDYPDYHAWEKFFFELSKGTQEIKLSQLETYIKPDDFKMKKEILKRSIKSYAKVVKKANFDEDGVVTLDEWLAWITQKKTNLDRRKFMLKPWKSFIVVLSVIQLIIGIGDRSEKYSVCGWYNVINEGTPQEKQLQHCLEPRPFHDKMTFMACLRFQPWRYITHAFVHHGLPHLFINLMTQLFFRNLMFLLNLLSQKLHFLNKNKVFGHNKFY